MNDNTFDEFTQPAVPTTNQAIQQSTDSPVNKEFEQSGSSPQSVDIKLVDNNSGLPNSPQALLDQHNIEERSGTLSVQLTEEQELALTTILKWLDDPLTSKQQFNLGGYAGTGKTTLIKELKARLRDKGRHITICAFTGKAVNVLQRKGLYEAQTMHSLMYDVEQDLETGAITFSKKWRLLQKTDLIIVDEASMLNVELLRDVLSYKVKVLFVGDPGQLEPVGDNPNVMASCDFTLSKIHRQAEKSPILTFAHEIRNGGRVVLCDKGDLIVKPKQGFTIPMANEVDQVICAKNKTRTEINKRFRLFLNKSYTDLVEGDKIIVLRNNTQCMVFNGMILFVDKVHQPEKADLFWKVDCHDEIDRKFHKLRVWKEPFFKDIGKDFTIPKWDKVPLVYADWGYCITCHKSQGSEWDSVLIWDEWMPPQVWDMKRWRYTAITRAAQKLIYCV